jgi:hypothetical protein
MNDFLDKPGIDTSLDHPYSRYASILLCATPIFSVVMLAEMAPQPTSGLGQLAFLYLFVAAPVWVLVDFLKYMKSLRLRFLSHFATLSVAMMLLGRSDWSLCRNVPWAYFYITIGETGTRFFGTNEKQEQRLMASGRGWEDPSSGARDSFDLIRSTSGMSRDEFRQAFPRYHGIYCSVRRELNSLPHIQLTPSYWLVRMYSCG